MSNSVINGLGYKHDSKSKVPFNRLTPADAALCVKIAERGMPLLRALNAEARMSMPYPDDAILYAMDIAAVHVMQSIALLSFLHAEAEDFAHDFSAIIRTVDRNTGRLPVWIVLRHHRANP